ncbi:hypothetical protein BGZ95_002244 [Linnemannia exigua]|uniref:Ion transport domain-containing protein n=1 Tax=Linnemannia exigua TaxID=604196 RepID=A0AAD4H9H7_9FUNG|nr:hypothetical protein BGZ95_002244 [Linnemannia exigua]
MVLIEEISDEYFTLDMLDDSSADAEGQGQIHIGAGQQQGAEDSFAPEGRGEVICHDFAGNRQYAAELVETDRNLSIELWLTPDSNAGRSDALLQCRVFVEKPILESTIYTKNAYNISLSYNASWISLNDATVDYLPKPESGKLPAGLFRIYEVVRSSPSLLMSPDQSSITLRRSATAESLPGLSNYYGFGEFHIADDGDDDNIKKEVFITCNGASVQVYSLYGGWKYLHTVSLDHPERASTRFNVATEMITSLQGRLFAWMVHGTDMIAVYDMEQGSMVSSVTRTCLDRGQTAIKTALDISDNGVLLAVCREGTLTTHFTKNGKLHKVLHLPAEFSNVKSISFTRGNSRLAVNIRQEGTSRLDRRGLLINVEDLSILDTFSTPETGHLQRLRFEDLNFIPYHPTTCACDDTCQSTMSPLCQHPTEATRSGLHFQVELQSTVVVLPWESQDLRSVVVRITSADGRSSKTFTIPPACDYEDWWLYKTAVLLKDRGQLVVEGEGVSMIWGLPTSYDDDFTLVLAWLIGPRNAEWATCSHHQLYYRQRYALSRRGNNVNDDDDQLMWIPVKPEVGRLAPQGAKLLSFLKGIDVVICMSLQASEAFKRAIFQYVSLYESAKAFKTKVLAVVIANWSRENYDSLERFMTAFLNSPWGVMHPTMGSVSYVRLVLLCGEKDPRSVGIARVLIDNCIRQARAAMDVEYLIHITRSLPELLNPKQPHSVLALHTLRRLAYFPVSSRKFIINHHTIAHPPTFQLWPWGRHMRPLHLCKDPILQLSGKRIYDPQNDNFTRDLFVAPFDMLWEVREEAHRNGTISETVNKLTVARPFHLAHQFLRAVLYKLTPERNARVRCYDFTLEMLDNPALAALVEYKWNTIGFKYWLVRFLCQCCFFLLILVTVLMQAYNNPLKSSEAIYIAIISCSAVFLYLEFIQCFRGWARYFKSMYNLVDLLAFGFPLAAAINQLLVLREITLADEVTMQLNAGLFGFSVPLISLHFLFELRVLKTVSQFVVIITRIIGRIRVFFIIFFAGLVAFTIAILHVLFSCPVKDTEKCVSKTQLPKHFFRAFTATYFLMGGRYDPITSDLDSDNWAFQMLMIAYFFFTVILMLNVLIALLNVAFNNGDISWQQVWLRNRMRVVESAENMSYQIPGFRETHNCFPQEIYYSVTHEQAKAYKRRWVPEGEGEYEDVLQDKGAQAVLLPGETGMGKTTMNSPMPHPITPPSDATQSPTIVSSENSSVGDAEASRASRPTVAPITVGELDISLKNQDASLRFQFAELEKQMQLQQTLFESQIEKMDARFQQLQESSNEQIRLLVDQLKRLHPSTDAQP